MPALGKTLHEEVASKMAAVRSLLWIRVLGKLILLYKTVMVWTVQSTALSKSYTTAFTER